MLLSVFTAFALVWASCEKSGEPGGSMFSALLLFVLCSVAGELFYLLRVPKLIGMLLVGLTLRNVGAIDGLPSSWMSVSKDCAVAVIMLRAGMGLDLHILTENGRLITLLSVVPGLVEATVAAGIAIVMYSRFGMTIGWGFMIGFSISDVSPAVTGRLLLLLQLY